MLSSHEVPTPAPIDQHVMDHSLVASVTTYSLPSNANLGRSIPPQAVIRQAMDRCYYIAKEHEGDMHRVMFEWGRAEGLQRVTLGGSQSSEQPTSEGDNPLHKIFNIGVSVGVNEAVRLLGIIKY